MALAVFKTYIAGEVLTASDLNSSLTTIHDNALTLISPLTASLDFDTFAGLFENMTAPATAASNIGLYARNLGGSNFFVREPSSGLEHQLTNSWDAIIWNAWFN